MKKYIFLFIFLFSFLSVYAQITATVPLNSTNYKNGTYLKDIVFELENWIGTWEGIVNDKQFTFKFTKFTQHQTAISSNQYYYRDELKGTLKVVDLLTNQIIYDNLNNTNYEEMLINGLFIAYDKEFHFWFNDLDVHCNNQAQFTLIKNLNNPNQVIYKDFQLGEYLDFGDCPFQNQADIPMFLPTSEFVLTKQ